ncbi:LysE family transporter [Paenibacillus sp. R14(2021)]|uniref:LysE family transporter n=1 Tax=Paenibacillus sp. R14(2021) TaxID=2859228 RepID=UPI001C615FF5|nr:LysE family transporter [Paenibacillus sp. R14(2021)]
MSVLFGYFLLGLSLSAPIGPINAAQLDKGMKHGFLHAWLIGIGAMMADIFFMVLVFFGLVHFISIPFIQTFLWLFGAFVLIYTGIESVNGARKVPLARSDSGNSAYGKTLLSGFLLSVSNPLSILFWLGIYGSVLIEMTVRYDTRELAAASLAIIAGIAFWDISMAGLAGFFRKWLNGPLIQFISIISGLSLIGFGAYFGFEAFRMLFG